MSAESRVRQRVATAGALLKLVPAFAVIGVLKRVVPIAQLARWMWRPSRAGADARAATLAIGRVLRAGQLSGLPDRDCVQRSLLLYRELSRLGLEPTLAVGFRRTNGALEGHAWVLSGGRVVAENPAALDSFTPALLIGPRGSILPTEAAAHGHSLPSSLSDRLSTQDTALR